MSRVAALFPGQGSHQLGMGALLADTDPAAAEVFAATERVLPGLTELVRQGPLEELTRTANQQPALLAASLAAYRAYLAATGQLPFCAAGHSLGEFSAHVAAGSFSLEQALVLVRRRGQLMQEAVPEGEGAMAAAIGDPAVVEELCAAAEAERLLVEVANRNAPTQTVVSGSQEGVLWISQKLHQRGLRVIPLKVSAPFHCSLMEPAAERMAAELEPVQLGAMSFPVLSNVTAEPVDPGERKRALTAQITAPVRWVECVERMVAMGVTEFIEFGPGSVLSGLVARIHPGALVARIHTPDDLSGYLQRAG